MRLPWIGFVVLAACARPAATSCEAGGVCPPGLKCVDDARVMCVEPTCGNGTLDATETCDDGNNISGDGCPADCTAPCGDGLVDPGEVCDDGNAVSGDGCSAACDSLESCGNGSLDPGEQCDDGNLDARDGCASTCPTETPTWQLLDAGPPARAGAAAAFDAAHGAVVMFGGCSVLDPMNGCAYTPFGETWLWDGVAWAQHTAQSDPPPRAFQGMAFDAARGRIVMFGGCAGSMCAVRLGDTWEWDGTRWHEKTPASSPPARGATTMTYDAARGTVVLFGGCSNDGPMCMHALADTWEWDGATWTQISSTLQPPGRAGAVIAFDATRGNDVLLEPDGHTWVFGGGQWQHASAAARPTSVVRATMTYDAVLGAVIAYGG